MMSESIFFAAIGNAHRAPLFLISKIAQRIRNERKRDGCRYGCRWLKADTPCLYHTQLHAPIIARLPKASGIEIFLYLYTHTRHGYKFFLCYLIILEKMHFPIKNCPMPRSQEPKIRRVILKHRSIGTLVTSTNIAAQVAIYRSLL